MGKGEGEVRKGLWGKESKEERENKERERMKEPGERATGRIDGINK